MGHYAGAKTGIAAAVPGREARRAELRVLRLARGDGIARRILSKRRNRKGEGNTDRRKKRSLHEPELLPGRAMPT